MEEQPAQKVYTCNLCGVQKGSSNFSAKQLHNKTRNESRKTFKCMDCEKIPTFKCNVCAENKIGTCFSPQQMAHRKQNELRGSFRCMTCENDPTCGTKPTFTCNICGDNKTADCFSKTQMHNRTQNDLRGTFRCMGCENPICTSQPCPLCTKCRDPACTQPNKCKRAQLELPVELRPKNKDERDAFKCVLCLYTKCINCGTYAKYKVKKRHLETRTSYKCVTCSQRELTQKDRALCANPK